MPHVIHLQLPLATFAGWADRRQARVLDYLIEEDRVLEDSFRGKRLGVTDNQRRRLAAKGKVLGRQLLAKVAAIVTPDAIIPWHRGLFGTSCAIHSETRASR